MAFPKDPNAPQVAAFNTAVSAAALAGVSRRIQDREAAKSRMIPASELFEIWNRSEGEVPRWPS